MWQQISGACRVRVRQQHTDAAHQGEKQQKHMHEFSTNSARVQVAGGAVAQRCERVFGSTSKTREQSAKQGWDKCGVSSPVQVKARAKAQAGRATPLLEWLAVSGLPTLKRRLLRCWIGWRRAWLWLGRRRLERGWRLLGQRSCRHHLPLSLALALRLNLALALALARQGLNPRLLLRRRRL